MSGARVWPLTTAVAGAVTLAIVIAFGGLPEVRAAYASGEFAAAFSAFQRVTTMAELDALFGDPADPARLAAMSAGNALDLYAFIPAYIVFLIAATAMLAGGLRKPVAWLAIVPALVGAGADVFETWTQMQMTADWSRAPELLPLVAPACWTKYVALALHGLACSAIAFLGAPRRWLIGALGLVPMAGILAFWAGALQIPSPMTMVFGIFWIALLALAVMAPWRTVQSST